MTGLSHQSIRAAVEAGKLIIQPFQVETHLGPDSYDLSLDQDVLLWPGRFVLRSSLEYFALGANLKGEVTGRSSVGRLGVFVIVAAGHIDPGFYGRITLEIVNAQPWYLILWPSAWKRLKRGDSIAQITFDMLDEPTVRPYQGRYQGQLEATASRFRSPNWMSRTNIPAPKEDNQP